ncbi:lamin tail domain-containing protein [Patescibacteria group bacterium]|nr:lamin tail domain-containing protein [Patescibacteria group bacterium]
MQRKVIFPFIGAVLWTILICFFTLTLKVEASESDLLFSEIMYDASGADSGHEWIEIFNSGQEDVVASSTWRFFDGANHNINLYQGTTTIASQEYFVLADNAENFLVDYPDFNGTVFDTVMSLPNSSSTIGLSFDNGQSYLIESFYDASWGGGDGFSLEKILETWQQSCLLGGSPGVANQECETDEPSQDSEPEINYWSQIVISEFLPNPEGSDDNEWIELYNLGPEIIDLSGFVLGDDSSRRFTLDQDAGIDLGLLPNSYLVVYKNISGISLNNSGTDSVRLYTPEEILQERVEYNGPALENRSYARSDSGFVWTKNPTPGQANQIVENQAPIAQILAEGTFNISQKISFSGENSSDPEGEDLDYFWDFGDGQTSSKASLTHKFEQAGHYTIVLTVTDPEGLGDRAEFVIDIYPINETSQDITEVEKVQSEEKIFETNLVEDDLIISEIMPNPKGSDDNEWIELYNATDNDINLFDWSIDDAEGGSKPYQFATTTIKANSFLIVYRQDSKITLNNSSDSVRLIRPDGKIWQEVMYEKIPEDKTYAWDMENSEWFVASPTPASPNLNIPEPEIMYQVLEIKNLEKNNDVLIQGVVLNKADKNTRSVYLADFDGEKINFAELVEIYNYYKDWPALSAGQVATLRGQISNLDDLPRIKIKSADQIWSNDQKINFKKPEPISTDDLDSDFLGSFVSVKGIVVKKSGKNIYLSTEEGGESNIRVYTTFSLADLEIKKGSEVIASGILSETDSGFKMTPFTIDDILVSQEVLGEKISESVDEEMRIVSSTNQAVVDNRGKSVKNILFLLIVAIFILGLIAFVKKKRASGLTERSHT